MMPDVFPLFPSFQDRYVARAYICGAIAKVSSSINRSTCSRNPVLLPFISHGGQNKTKLVRNFQIEMFSLEDSTYYIMFVLRSTTDVKRITKVTLMNAISNLLRDCG